MFDSMELVAIKKLGGKVTQPIDPEFLPPGYGGGGDCDWNIMKNKPFYSEMGEGEIFTNTRLTFTEGQAIIDGLGLVVGKTYTVNWGGNQYECTAQAFETMVGLGDIGAMIGGESTGEPFAIAEDSTAGMAVVVALDGKVGVNLTITGEMELVTPMDEKYLPGGMTKYIDFVAIDKKYLCYIGKTSVAASSNELIGLYKSGYNLVGRVKCDDIECLLYLTDISVERVEFTFTAVRVDSGGVRVYAMKLDGASGTLSQYNVTATAVTE